MSEQSLTGKIALITGAGRGIGREIALRLARDGADIVVHYASSRAGAEQTATDIRAIGRKAWLVQADITRRAEVITMFGVIDAEVGQLDIAVNNSGASISGTLADVTDEQIELGLGLNLLGPLYVASEAAKRIGQGGRIINLGSTNSEFPLAGAGLYGAAKTALKHCTVSWAKELGRKGATCNMVIPGAISPGMIDRNPQYKELYANASPFARIGEASEVAAVVAFLASPEASWVSGAHIVANGAANM
jgi:3-oxoacyl-[acyl-carrier protein] reductase